MKRKIRVGSRESKLAVVQAQMVMEYIRQFDAEIELELVTMKTTGDKILDKTLDKIGGKGLFVKELERALLDGDIDICVHSFKDMPMEENEQLPVVALGKREEPWDVLILPTETERLSYEKPIGSASQRRTVQLKQIDPKIAVKPVRGNVLTRLQKLDDGEFAGLVLAYAGIKRLGLERRISKVFTVEEMVPAACQGILAVQARAGDNTGYLQLFKSEASQWAAQAEREFVKTLGCGCSSPVGAYATIHQNEIKLTGLFLNETTQALHVDTIQGEKEKGRQLGEQLARTLMARR